MLKPSGSVTLSATDIQDCLTIEDMAVIMREKGVPIKGYIDPAPHPDYEYTENVDYSRHSITITWEKIQ